MHNLDGPPRVEWRTAITITTDKHGRISRETVRRAVDGMTVVSGLIDIIVDGPVEHVDLDAALDLAFVIGNPTEIRVTAHGRGIPELMEAIRFGLQQEANFRAYDRHTRELHHAPGGRP